MKLIKDFSRIALVAALACSFALTSCKKDDEDEKPSCEEIKAQLTSAETAYDNDTSDSKEICNTYLTALKASANSDCYTAEEKQLLQLEIALFDGFGGCQ
ncbi:hypothetical protein V9L05_05380 [Bernardetia sp. Wsw4-3y2]|uniref:hypothetical protein n=1 Tax=unclassified Bernardetia TaxID=2647129 RepID=UPI0030D0C0F0